MYCRVVPDIPKISDSYWYSCSDATKNSQKITVGSNVRIPLHGRRVRGWVVQIFDNKGELSTKDGDSLDAEKIKDIIEYVGDGPPPHIIELTEKLARRYLMSQSTFLRAASPSKIIRTINYAPHVKESACSEELVVVDPRADRRNIIKEHIASNGSTLIIAPDSHTKLIQWISSLGHKTIEYRHADKKDVAFQAAAQNKCVVVGGRTALFAPVTDCHSIIILDDAYEQLTEERSPKWNVSDCARIAAEMWGSELTFVSSVPSVVTHDVPVTDARTHNAWPQITIDNKNSTDPALGIFSPTIISTIRKALESNHDAAVIINNTSLARLLVCRSCETIATCTQCDHAVHQDDDDTHPFICPMCHTRRPALCEKCGSSTFKKYRRGLSSLTQDCAALFPRNRVVEVSKNHEVSPSQDPTLYVATEALFHRSDLTQNLACCIFIDIDSTLFRTGISAFEQTLVLVNRALRTVKKSDIETPIILSTRSPENVLLKDLSSGDFVSNRERELILRQQLKLAPFYATAEVASQAAAIDKLASDLDASIVSGTKKDKDTHSVFLRADDHEELTKLAFGPIAKIRLNYRCTLSVDFYD